MDIPVDGQLVVVFSAPTYFGYTAGKAIRIIRASDGVQMGPSIDLEPGDPQEGQTHIEFDLSVFGLAPDTTYYVQADHLFARLNAAPWNVSAIAAGQWTFTTGKTFAPLLTPVAGIVQVSPPPGATQIPLDGHLIIEFSAPTNFGDTTNKVLRIVRAADGLPVEPAVDLEPGDVQEGQDYLELSLTEFNLAPGTAYYIVADHLFTRLTAAPWNVTAIAIGEWASRRRERLQQYQRQHQLLD